MTIASDDRNSDLTTSDCAQTQAANGQPSAHNTASNRMRRFSDDFLLIGARKLLSPPSRSGYCPVALTNRRRLTVRE